MVEYLDRQQAELIQVTDDKQIKADNKHIAAESFLSFTLLTWGRIEALFDIILRMRCSSKDQNSYGCFDLDNKISNYYKRREFTTDNIFLNS